MAHASFQCKVDAPFEVLWKILLDEVEHPNHFNPGIHGAQVLERFPDGILRVVAVPDADVRERVEFHYDKGEIKSTFVGHPQLVATILKTVRPVGANAKGPLALTCELEWQSTHEGVDRMIRRNMEAFVMSGLDQVRVRAEKEAKAARS